MLKRTTVQSINEPINHSDFDPPKPLKKINLVINKNGTKSIGVKERVEGEFVPFSGKQFK